MTTDAAYLAWVAAQLEACAAAHTLDAQHISTPADRKLAHRMTADALRDIARDVQEGPA